MKCGYIRQTWDCGNTREVEEKHTGRYGARGQKRQKRRKATPEEIAKQNQWKRERDVRRLIKWNFGIGDYWFTLTYKKGSRPPWKQMQKDMSKFIRKLRDKYVVHTYTDGTGGDYSSCYTVFSVFLGDTDVSDHIDEIKAVASDGITGIWNPQTRKYQVTAMSTDNGYVDISALYGLEGKVLLVGGKGLVIGGKTMIVKSMGSWITKRFSVSKAKDGKIGLSYDLRVSTQIIRKQKDDKTLKPANVTFSAYKNDNGSVSSYSGKFQIEESKDSGKTYEIKYGSSSAELLTVYTPSSPDVQIIRCSLYDSSGVQLLDTQTVSIVSDAAGLAQDIAAVDQKAQEAKEAIQTTSQEVTEIKSGMEGFETKLSKATADLQGVTDGTLLYNTKCQDNGDGTTTVSAALYKAGVEVTKEYPTAWFSWSRRTEQGEAFLQYGYSVTVNNDDYMFGGVVIGQFIRYVQMALTVGDKILVIGNKAMCVNVDA